MMVKLYAFFKGQEFEPRCFVIKVVKHGAKVVRSNNLYRATALRRNERACLRDLFDVLV
jgi:hypothetical protein